MPLTRWSYYSQFAVYPAVVIVLAGLALRMTPATAWWRCGLLFLAAVAAWTLAEYLVHRFVLHGTLRMGEMHEVHHRDHHALVGISPVMIVPACLALLLAPLWCIVGPAFAVSLTAGWLFGYFWCVTAHHLAHHRPARPGALLFALKRRHALHHQVTRQGNFGVTSGLWDRVFGTDILPRRNPARAQAKGHTLAAE